VKQTTKHSPSGKYFSWNWCHSRKETGWELLYSIVRTNIQFGTTLKRQNLWNPGVQSAVIQDINKK